jgi:4-alpha-glucanotransferase
MEPNRQIAALGRLCGIAPEYWDNFGVWRPTSTATYQLLLTAMGVPWEEPEQLSREIEGRRLRPWLGLAENLGVVLTASGPPRLIIAPWTPTAELAPLRVSGKMKDEAGRESTWETTLPVSPPLARRAVNDHIWGKGFRTRLELPLPPGLKPGYYHLELAVSQDGRQERSMTRLVAAPPRVYAPSLLESGGRLWGLSLPLYALKSEGNWGMGDFADLRETIDWAGELGAAFVGVNPLHACHPGKQTDPSPYSPSSRVFRNFLYLHLEGVPEFMESRAARELLASPDVKALKARLQAAELVDYTGVYRLKRQILALLYQTFLEVHGPPENPRTARGREFAGFVEAGGLSLLRFGQYNALADFLGLSDWHTWPREYQEPENQAVAAFTRQHPEEIHGHQYFEWLVAAQLAEADGEARKRGLRFPLYQDLALGAHPGGAETWAQPHLFALDAAMGAPPDAFNPGGQNWGLPPLIPERLRQEGYRLFIDTLRANLPPDGLLRLDHVMGLFRLFWIPPGRSAADGAYVYYPAREMLGILALESHRRRTLIIGEDLGTVAPRVRRELARRGVFSYRVFYFERTGENQFKDPADYPEKAMATVTTHDLPTLAGYWQGEDIKLKSALGLYPQDHPAAADAAARTRDRERLLQVSGGRAADKSCPELVRFGVLEYLARSRAVLLEVRLEEIFGVPFQQNLPGTTTQYPNWRRKLPLSIREMRWNPAAARLAAGLQRYRGVGEDKPGGRQVGKASPPVFRSRRRSPLAAKQRCAMSEATLIYNLFPPLVGSMNRWEKHLERIAALGFTWIYLNPIHTPGLSGSLYAVQDYFGINPLFQPESGKDPAAALAHFVKAAARRGLKVMLDLVINHTAIDSPLTKQHPEWYAKDEKGAIKHPGAIDPADATKVTVWGDLAELEYWPPPDPEGLLHFWDTVVSHYLRLGCMGFRADAAYKIPGEIWDRLIGEARKLEPGVEFFAETLGCRLEECAQLSSSGFDFLYNSSKWWDFQADWCLEQYNRFRHLAPSISFPETHDTERLAAETHGAVEVARQRYLFAAFFSTGLMLPMGYEFGFQKRLNVVRTRPQDWEKPTYDLGSYITGVNRMKKNCPVLLEEGPLVRVSPVDEPVVLLLKGREKRRGRVLAVINSTQEEQRALLPHLGDWLGKPKRAWQDLTPDLAPLKLQTLKEFSLAPAGMRIFSNPEAPLLPKAEPTE